MRVSRATFTSRVAVFFLSHPHEWVSAIALESVGGRQAWRTRVSECRRTLRMDIRNRQYSVTRKDGSKFQLSEYCYIPSSEPVQAGLPMQEATR